MARHGLVVALDDKFNTYRGAANTLSKTDTVPANVTISVDRDEAVKSIQKGNMTANLFRYTLRGRN